MNQLVQFEAQPSVILEDDDIAKVDYDSEAEAEGFAHTSRDEIFDTKELKAQRLEETGNEYGIVGKSLVGGRRELGKKVKIVGIHKKRYDWSEMDEARLAVFRVFAAAVASRNGGEANIKYGWYGGSRDEIKEIMMYGFRRFEHRGFQYGRGLHLSAANNPMESAKTSVPDSDGLMHVLLCRVILGRPELVNFGSQRDQPSSMKFDSGVNHITSPTKYVIWEHNMNARVLPVYIISFRIDLLTGTSSIRIPTSPHMGINGLMSRLTNYLSSSKMVVIKKLQHEYHERLNEDERTHDGCSKQIDDAGHDWERQIVSFRLSFYVSSSVISFGILIVKLDELDSRI